MLTISHSICMWGSLCTLTCPLGAPYTPLCTPYLLLYAPHAPLHTSYMPLMCPSHTPYVILMHPLHTFMCPLSTLMYPLWTPCMFLIVKDSTTPLCAHYTPITHPLCAPDMSLWTLYVSLMFPHVSLTCPYVPLMHSYVPPTGFLLVKCPHYSQSDYWHVIASFT